MFSQNSMFCADTGWPLDHLYGLSVIVTVLPPLLHTGRLARLLVVFTVGWVPVPNQYSGRYIRYWNRLMLETLM